MNPDRLKRKNELDGSLLFGTGKFNRATGRDNHLVHRDNLKNQFLDPQTGRLKKDLCRERPCPVCEATLEELLFIKNGFRHVRCRECRFIYVNPILNEERLHNFYLGEESYSKVLTNELQIDLDRKKFHYGLEIVEKYAGGKRKLLDIGCGPGISAEVAKARGWEIQTLEFNAWCVKRLAQMGIPNLAKPLQGLRLPDQSYQCVTAWTVLEHIQNPREFLSEVFRLLSPGGVLLILVPNIDSLAARILHEKCSTFSGDAHINFFNTHTLSLLLKKTGFVPRESETLLTERGTVANYLSFTDPYFGEGSFNLDCFTPEYIHRNMLGYLLLSVSTKPQ